MDSLKGRVLTWIFFFNSWSFNFFFYNRKLKRVVSFRFCCFRWVDTFCFILCCLFKLLDIKANGFFFFLVLLFLFVAVTWLLKDFSWMTQVMRRMEKYLMTWTCKRR
jgi:hypothetical protein